MCPVGIIFQMFSRVRLYKPEGRGFDSRLYHWNFHRHNPSDRAVALGSTQPITEIVPGIFSEGKSGRCVGLTNLPYSCAVCLEIWEPKLPGTIWICTWIAWTVLSNTVQYVCIFSIVHQFLYLHFVLYKSFPYFLILKYWCGKINFLYLSLPLF